MRILVACEYSGTVRDAFAAKGHDAWSCDILPTDVPGNHYQGDVKDILHEGWDMVISHPPCTYLTVSGNRWYKDQYKDKFPTRQQDRENAIDFFMMFANANIEKIAIENPIGIMSSKYRKPNQVIQPWMFGHKQNKATCLWLKNLPNLVPTNIVGPMPKNATGDEKKKWNAIHLLTPSPDRWKLRSKTFDGIAAAMADQWGIIYSNKDLKS